MECPICKKTIEPEIGADGVTRAFCDCIGFRRAVIEIIPPAPDQKTAPVKKEHFYERTN
jgi:hypothetical protein